MYRHNEPKRFYVTFRSNLVTIVEKARILSKNHNRRVWKSQRFKTNLKNEVRKAALAL